MTETEKIGAVIVTAVKAAHAPLVEEIGRLKGIVATLEARPPVVGEKGQDGRDAQPVDLELLAKQAAALVPVPKDGDVGPAGEKGCDGKDGQDAQPVDIDLVVKTVVALLPAPNDGAVGPEGPTGPSGADGKDANEIEIAEAVLSVLKKDVADAIATEVQEAVSLAMAQVDVAALVKAQVDAAVSALPAPRDGVNGKDGQSIQVADVEPLIVTEVEKAVAAIPRPKDGLNGKDGIGVLGALLDREGQLVVTLSDGTTKQLGVVVGRDADMGEIARLITEKVAAIPVKEGAPGRDGRNGTIADMNFKLAQVDERTFQLYAGDGEPVSGGLMKFDVVLDRGVYQNERAYEKGDGVTYSGSFWIAQEDTKGAKPGDVGEASRAWRLSVKRGQDGRKGDPGAAGEKGRDGKDFGR